MDLTILDAGGEQIHDLLDIDGLTLNHMNKTADVTANIVRNVKNLKIREDDVMLCTPPKSGSHWMFEILTMLLANEATISDDHKIFQMLSNVPEDKLDATPSPRVLNSHLPFRLLPSQLEEKKTKTVVILRNPKDVAVSYYHHHRGLRFHKYNGKFSDYLPLFMEGKLEYNSWFDYVLDVEKAANAEPDRIYILYYEDLVENGVDEIQKLAAFLQIPAANDPDLCKAINDKCSFSSYKALKPQDEKVLKLVCKDDFRFARKGIVGDWKNHFTVAESEAFDKLFAEKMKDSKLKFRFEPSTHQCKL